MVIHTYNITVGIEVINPIIVFINIPTLAVPREINVLMVLLISPVNP